MTKPIYKLVYQLKKGLYITYVTLIIWVISITEVKMGKLLLVIKDSLHRDLKVEAVKKDIHLKDYIIEILKNRKRWVEAGTQYTNKK